MGKMIINDKIGVKEKLRVMDMKPGYTYQVTFNDGMIHKVLACRTDGWHIDIGVDERLIVFFDNSLACVVDDNVIIDIKHINVEINITD